MSDEDRNAARPAGPFRRYYFRCYKDVEDVAALIHCSVVKMTGHIDPVLTRKQVHSYRGVKQITYPACSIELPPAQEGGSGLVAQCFLDLEVPAITKRDIDVSHMESRRLHAAACRRSYYDWVQPGDR